MGDFNAGTTNTFGGLLEDFCMENDFMISDYALLPQDTFTYLVMHTTQLLGLSIDHFHLSHPFQRIKRCSIWMGLLSA